MSNKILFVFEGENTEKQIATSLEKSFFPNGNTTVKCAYGGEIYQIYKAIKADEYLDTFNLIKARNIKQNKVLEDYTRNDFAEIYLFFDYDGHSSLADDDKLQELLAFFDEETDKGKLYISYPMAEALKHIENHETFRDLTVKCKQNINYKNLVPNVALKELMSYKKYDIDIWQKVVKAHLQKANFIANNVFELPSLLISQNLLFSQQLEKYIGIEQTVAVLSAFPLFIHDYFGNEKTKQLLNK